MIWLLAAALLAGASPPSSVPSQTYSVDLWEVDDGLPQNSVISMIQTRDGYLWIGTWAGLVRFDGVRFTPIAAELTNTHILALMEAADGSVWIGTGGGGVARWRDGATTTLTKADGLIDDSVTRLATDRAGRIWVGTVNGVSVIDGDTIQNVRVSTGVLPPGSVTALALAADGRMIVGTATGVCAATDLDVVCPPAPPAPSTIAAIAVDSADRILVGTEHHGVLEWTGNTFAPGPCGAPECRGAATITSMQALADGEIVIGLREGVVTYRPDGTAHRFADLPIGTVRPFVKDAEGSLWFGMDGAGLGRVRPTRVIGYGTEAGLPSPVTGSIVQDAHGDIWAGSRCGPVMKFDRSGRFEPPPTAMRMPCTVSILAARDGSLWLGGGRGDGILHVVSGTVRRFNAASGLSGNSVRVLYQDRAGAVWVALEDSERLHRISGDRIDSYGRGDGVEGGSVSAFVETPDGRLFAGSNAYGLMAFDGTRFNRVEDEGLPTRLISSLMTDSRNDLWIGTANRGLYRWRAGRFEHFGVEHGLPDPVVALTIEDDESNLWVATSRGISRLLRDRIEAVASGAATSLEPIVLGKADGMRSLEGSGGGFDPSGLKDRDGRLWFSTLGGIVVIDPAQLTLNTVPPPVVIEHVILDDRDVRRAAGSVDVPAGTRGIEFAYTAFSLLAPRQVRFRYRLAGFDEAWHEAGPRRSASYTNLPPDKYRFEVMAANNDGTWSEQPATLTLVVQPFWWQRGAVQLAGLAVLLVITGTGVRSVVLRRARARLAELEHEQALDRERSRIARDLHDDIGARLTHLALLADEGDVPESRRQLSEIARDTAHTMDELVWSVNADNDTVEGLANYAMRFAETHARAAGLRCRFQAPARLEGRLDAETRRHLFLAIKEAVNNVVKHAGASELRVRLALDAGTLSFEISDDGVGIAEDGGDPTGNGLSNMRARLHAIGGTVSFARAAGGGTTVTFRAPLQP